MIQSMSTVVSEKWRETCQSRKVQPEGKTDALNSPFGFSFDSSYALSTWIDSGSSTWTDSASGCGSASAGRSCHPDPSPGATAAAGQVRRTEGSPPPPPSQIRPGVVQGRPGRAGARPSGGRLLCAARGPESPQPDARTRSRRGEARRGALQGGTCCVKVMHRECIRISPFCTKTFRSSHNSIKLFKKITPTISRAYQSPFQPIHSHLCRLDIYI